jgi:hypothetical protein
MFRATTLLSALVIALAFGDALAAPASPIHEPSVNTLPFTTQFRNGTAKNIVAADRARIAQIKKTGAERLAAKEAASPAKRASYSFTVTNAAVSSFGKPSCLPTEPDFTSGNLPCQRWRW